MSLSTIRMRYLQHRMRKGRNGDGMKMAPRLVNGTRTTTSQLVTVALRHTWMQRPLSTRKVFTTI